MVKQDIKVKQALQKLHNDTGVMDAMRVVAGEMISNWDKSIIGNTEFETLKAAIIKETRTETLKAFFNELESKAYGS